MSDIFKELYVMEEGSALPKASQAASVDPSSSSPGIFAPLLSCPENGHNIRPQGTEPVESRESINSTIPLWNRKAPQYVRQQELPWHRYALELAAKGLTAREIAGRIGCTAVTVQDILRQPQYQQTQTDLIRRESDKDHEVYETIKENIVEAVQTLAAIVRDRETSPAYRIAAAKELLDRRYGKPNQPINRNTDIDLSSLTDEELIQRMQKN